MGPYPFGGKIDMQYLSITDYLRILKAIIEAYQGLPSIKPGRPTSLHFPFRSSSFVSRTLHLTSRRSPLVVGEVSIPFQLTGSQPVA